MVLMAKRKPPRPSPGRGQAHMTPEEVRRIRDTLDITQEDAGKRVGISRRTWQEYERGRKKVTRPMAILIRLLGEGKL